MADTDNLEVWRVHAAGGARQQERMRAFLSAEEIARADRFRFEQDKVRFVTGHYALRCLLSRRLDCKPGRIAYCFGAHGKPALSGHTALFFNLSDSGEWSFIALGSQGEMGVDVEMHKPRRNMDGVARRFFAEGEVRDWLALSVEERFAGFFRCWTRKEAFIKAKGGGLTIPLGDFRVSLGEEARLLEVRWDAAEAAAWRLENVPAPEGYSASVCAPSRNWELDCRDFTAFP